MILFIRFGELPQSGKSRNHLTEQDEAGVSVYEAVERKDGRIQVLLPRLDYSACVSLSGCIDRPAFIVHGEIVGYGSDGEPLLRDCRVVRAIAKEELRVPC